MIYVVIAFSLSSTGLGVAVTDILLYSHPKGYLQTAGRFVRYMGPFTVMAATFAGTVCIATTVREKDDRLNYLLGGVAAGSIYGAARGSLHAGLGAAFGLGIIAFAKKWKIEAGMDKPIQVNPHKISLFDTRAHDYSGLKGKY